MHNPRPDVVFFEDIGRSKSSDYCHFSDGRVVEVSSYDSIGMYVVRVWVPEIRGDTSEFNAHMVKCWYVDEESWYDSRVDACSNFKSVCKQDTCEM